ncbi:MAG: flagellar basal body P-ring formation chaperone FlgA [Propionivibrio sp.]
MNDMQRKAAAIFPAVRPAICLLLVLMAHITPAAPNTPDKSPLYMALDDFLRAQTQGLPGKVSYVISPLDTRTQLPACDAFEPFVPQGGKLWGRTTLGVRCLGPSTWTIYVPTQITVNGDYLTTTRPLAAGTVLDATSIVVRSGDLSTLPSSVLMDPAQAIGKTLKSGLAAGQPLRSDQLTAQWAVQQGQTVRMISHGDGFSVSAEGKALTSALEGQVVQVRAASGQTVSGIARSGGIVEVTH